MSRADIEAAFASETTAKTERRCKVGRQIALLEPDEQSLVTAKIADESYPTDMLVRVLGRLGAVTVTPTTLRLHRNRQCACSR